MNDQLGNVLNKQIADWSVLFIKLHNYHWYVKGPQFFTLHAKFEELYTEAAQYVDELAERLLAIGGQPVATMKRNLEISGVKEGTGAESSEQMVHSIIDDFSMLINDLKAGMEIAEKADDQTTGDLLLTIHASLEKHNWMLKSFVGKG